MIYRTFDPPQKVITLREFVERLRPLAPCRYGAITDVSGYEDDYGSLMVWSVDDDYGRLRSLCLSAVRMWWIVDFQTGVFLAQSRLDEDLDDSGLFEVTYTPNRRYPQRKRTIYQRARNKRDAVRKGKDMAVKFLPWDSFAYPVARKMSDERVK